MKKEYAKNLQKALFIAFALQFVAIQAAQPQPVKKEEAVLGYVESLKRQAADTYNKIGNLVKSYIPESIRNIGNKPYFYQSIAAGALAGAFVSGIRQRMNRYKIIALWPEVEKKVEEGIEWKEKAIERAAQVMAEGRNPWEDDTWADLYAKEQKSYRGADALLSTIVKAGVPAIVAEAFTNKVNEILGGMYVGKPKETLEEPQAIPSEK